MIALRKLRPSSLRLSSLTGTLIVAYILKCLVTALLLLAYRHQKSVYLSTSDPEQRRESEESLRRLMFAFKLSGATSREVGAPGVTGYLVYSLLFSLYYGFRWLLRRKITAGDNSGLNMFLRDRDRECARLAASYDRWIERLRLSNLTYTRLLLQSGSVRGHHRGRELLRNRCAAPGAALTGDESALASTKDLKLENSRWAPRRRGSRDGSSDSADETSDAIGELAEQLAHLQQLTRDKRSVWPRNRRATWHRRMLRLWLQLMALMTCALWLVSAAATHLAFLSAADHLERSQLLFAAADKRFYPMDKVDYLCQQLVALYVTDWFVAPIVYTLLSYVDQSEQLHAIRRRLLGLNRSLVAYRALLDAGRPDAGELARLRRSCDADATELYLVVQVYAQEVRIMFERSEHGTVFVYSTLIVVIMVLVAQMSASGGSGSLSLMAAVLVGVCNLGIYPSALLNSNCLETLAGAWSVLANAESIRELRLPSAELPPAERASVRLRSSPISAHTLHLWRQFIADAELLSNAFACTLFGLSRLTFDSVLQANFVIISAVGLLLANRASPAG